uniref:PPPDE domain-containing protein n=1 Tax=Clastoptera arizonana TaxID=38151 RepID=A0A1B6EE06_9HEMI
MSEEGQRVELYVYDLSYGYANQVSQFILGRHIEGVWHTAVVVFGTEYFFGSHGISRADPGGTLLGQPGRKLELGYTHVPRSVFEDYIDGLEESTFRGDKYNLLSHNCNNFTNEVSNFLVGQGIPTYILDVPEDVLNAPFGKTFVALIEKLSNSVTQRSANRESPEFLQLNTAIEEARLNSIALEERRNILNEKLARRERKKNKKKKREGKHKNSESEHRSDSGSSESNPPRKTRVRMSDTVEVIPGNNTDGDGGGRLPSEMADELEAEERREREEKKKNREPPVVFKEAVDVRIEFDNLVGLIDGKLSQDEMTSLEELHQYMLEDEGSWALGENFLLFIGRLLNDKSLPEEVCVHALNVLACAGLKDDVILVLHQDRKDHILMNFAYEIDRLSLNQQKALSLFVCNLFENLSSSEWLLYISEWQYNNSAISNIRVTTKVAVNSLLSDDADLRDRGTAIIHNLACKEVKTVVFDDVAVELTMALLQFFNGSPPEEQIFRCMKALAKFCQISGQDVPQLIQMIGPEPTKFKGASQRVDEQIALIVKKLR